ncbi:LodA/GoxA family CTQ-dependent oxidase [Hymenobacter terrigena]
MQYRIFPPIGFARLGQDDNFILGPEQPNTGPAEIDGTPVTQFKDATGTRIRKQGARFHLFESPDGQNWRPAALQPGDAIHWTVQLANTKAAVKRSNPPLQPRWPALDTSRQTRRIDSGAVTTSGVNQLPASLQGTYTATPPGGAPTYTVNVELGSIRTDSTGRLVVLGGRGFSSAPPSMPLTSSFYRNDGWHDDVADGPVQAEVRFADGRPASQADGAWVIVAPPDFAPAITGLVTLYDVLRQVGLNLGELPKPTQTIYDADIQPLIERARNLAWVNDQIVWDAAELALLTDPRLNLPAVAQQQLRSQVAGLIRRAASQLRQFALRSFQMDHLKAWEAGNFTSRPAAPVAGFTAAGLTQAALEATVGQGFFPGIEAGTIVLDPKTSNPAAQSLYVHPFSFRIDHTTAQAGDLTAEMAQPWQADFVDCNTDWWPSQRPDKVNGTADWARGIVSYEDMIQNFGRLGFALRDAASGVFVERERDPTF